MGKIIIGKTSEIPIGKLTKATADGRDILIVNIDGNFYACDDTCTHAGASLSGGNLEGSIVTCGWHGAKFNCTNGKLDKFPAKIKDLRTYRVIIESENLFVEF